MPIGGEGFLTLTVRMKVSPEPRVVELLRRYRDGLNYSVRRIIECKATSMSKAHKLLYNDLKVKFNLPPRIAMDCWREALSVVKSWVKTSEKGKMPIMKTLRMWLTPPLSYRIKGNYVEVLGGYRLRIVGWDKRYDQYPSREARLIYKDGKMFLMISKRIPKPLKHTSKNILAIDVNEKNIVWGNSTFETRCETAVERALHYRLLAEKLQKKYSSSRYRGWTRRKILKRIKCFHRKAKNIIEDWAKKVSYKIVEAAKENNYVIVREDLTNLIENLIKLPKEHKVRMIVLSYRRLSYWIDWQAEKHGVPIIIIEPRGTSSTCPICNSKLKENGYRKMKCSKCGFEDDRDTIAVLNIEKRAIQKMGGSLATPTAPQMKHVNPNRCGESLKKGRPVLLLPGQDNSK
jgi:IS605 OrfB family transposase